MAVATTLLSACAGSDDIPDRNERQSCSHNEILICRGGRAPIGRLPSNREPRICRCQAPDQPIFQP